MNYLLQGFILGLGYVAPIGMQNLYVINAAMKEEKEMAYMVAFVTIFFDISLALSCFFGVGALINKSQILKAIMMLLGSVVIIYIGINIIRSSSDISGNVKIESSFLKVVRNCFAVTWLNPQAIVDGSILLGGYNASIPDEYEKFFIIGICLASFLWFTLLSTIISLFNKKLDTNIIKWINIGCGIVIVFFGFKLGYSFIQMIR